MDKSKTIEEIKQIDSVLQWNRLSRFNHMIWTVLTGTLLARTTYFMAWPFLIVILYQDFNARAVTVGAILAGSAVVGSFTGLYSGWLSDKFGRKWVMIWGCIIAAFSYAGIGIATSIFQLFILVGMCGLMRPMIEAPAKAVIGDNLDDEKDRELALNVRYFLINVGGAIGPLIGITLGLAHPKVLFLITGVTYLAFGLFLFISFAKSNSEILLSKATSDVTSFLSTVRIISKDRLFIKLLAANVIMMFVYGQYESSIPQVIVRTDIVDAAKFVSGLVLVNTLTIVVLQFPMLKLLENIPLFVRTRIGMALMALAQLAFLLVPVDFPTGWLMACFILSVGEVIAFPTLNVQIDQLAPKHLRGSYFGAAAIYGLGFALAPLVGGLLIQLGGATPLFIACFVLSLLMIGLYKWAEREVPS
ncbi:MDR family MFS transporter [Aliivibrio fischeri]|uniref:Predicted transporter n=1 Tax=Aliivibrio fischeri (strain ATCC 700601 / ES114) TaxID=312309 RepID=Q5E120_ALIF1|nr:MFS transporter [Aliivibrio fischeri]AAW87276.1 predicted transporter [Aliivibrio fischeri ES114]KLU78080.1 MFS transporter [Aliivibrio fischeri]MCE7535870.1 MFS transporter [Aliivibrio fischeri]MCE7558532.1 MFS transporter [Aliivibrio fischeri]MCE7565768.1 MFS transporter [Aliivibrio fischeri]